MISVGSEVQILPGPPQTRALARRDSERQRCACIARAEPLAFVWQERSHLLDLGGVAQLGEHLLCKQGVIGSNPFTSTKRLRLVPPKTRRLRGDSERQRCPCIARAEPVFLPSFPPRPFWRALFRCSAVVGSIVAEKSLIRCRVGCVTPQGGHGEAVSLMVRSCGPCCSFNCKSGSGASLDARLRGSPVGRVCRHHVRAWCGCHDV